MVRYLHLNPLRAGLVPDVRGLDRYPWSGHAALVGRRAAPWQDTRTVLTQFGAAPGRARRAYRAFVLAGGPQGRRPEFQGGGLRRSAGGWAAVRALRRGREAWAADERILGRGPFVETVLREAAPPPRPVARPLAAEILPALLARCAAAWGLTPADLVSRSRRRAVAHARAVACLLAVREVGLAPPAVAHLLNISPTVVREGVLRGEDLAKSRGVNLARLVKAPGEYP